MQYRNNPLAPVWMWSGSYCPPAGAQDQFFLYVLRKPLTASELVSDQQFLFDGDACFLWRLSASARTGATSEVYLAWRDQLGRQLSNQLLCVPGFCGGAGEHCPNPVEETIEPGARWSFTAQENSNNAGIVHFALIGAKRRRVG